MGGLTLPRRRVRGMMNLMEPTTPPATTGTHDEATTFPVVTEYIGVRPGFCGGEPHILGHRIKVRHVAVWHEQQGMTPTEIAATYPTISLAQVHAALAYYYDHRKEILGRAIHRRVATYAPHDPEEPLSLQDHNQVVRYRNIWIRRLKGYDQQ